MEQFYEMDPETEDLIFGSQLENGMVVLVNDFFLSRIDPNKVEDLDSLNIHDRARLLTDSQWCRVSSLFNEGDITYFIGIYSDGVKRNRSYHKTFAWIVKKESM